MGAAKNYKFFVREKLKQINNIMSGMGRVNKEKAILRIKKCCLILFEIFLKAEKTSCLEMCDKSHVSEICAYILNCLMEYKVEQEELSDYIGIVIEELQKLMLRYVIDSDEVDRLINMLRSQLMLALCKEMQGEEEAIAKKEEINAIKEFVSVNPERCCFKRLGFVERLTLCYMSRVWLVAVEDKWGEASEKKHIIDYGPVIRYHTDEECYQILNEAQKGVQVSSVMEVDEQGMSNIAKLEARFL